MNRNLVVEKTGERAPQRFQMIFAAELRRMARQGGLRRSLLGTGLFSLLIGLFALFGILYLSDGQRDPASTLPVTVPVEASTSLMALIFAICVVIHVGRAVQGGAILTTLAVVPNRRRCFLGHVAAVGASTFVVTFLVSATVALVATSATGFDVGVGVAALGVLAGSFAAALLAVLASSIAMLLRSAIAAVLVVVGWWVILPLIFSVAGASLPGWLAKVASVLADVTPTNLLVEATTVSTMDVNGVANLLGAVGGLALWAALVSLLSGLAFERRSY